MSEVLKLLGKETFSLAERQARNVATNPQVAVEQHQRVQASIEVGNLRPDSETVLGLNAAVKGRFFGEDWRPIREGRAGVCMDDVTPEDR